MLRPLRLGCLLLSIMCVPTAARAQKEDPLAGENKAADEGRYGDCARDALAAAEQDTREKTIHLFNAARCYELDGDIGLAVATWTRLAAQVPEDEFTLRALGRLGEFYEQIADFEQAAVHYEAFAAKAPKDEAAKESLERAIVFRRALGHRKEALASIAKYTRLYGRTEPTLAADLALEAVDIYDATGKREKAETALARALRDHGGRAFVAEATARLGLLLHRRSCKRAPGEAGPCVAQKRPAKGVSRCDAGTPDYVLVRRDQAVAEKAKTHLEGALAIFAAVEADNALTPALREIRDEVAIELTDAAFEKVLTLRFPRNLDFHPNRPAAVEASTAAFLGWLTARTKISQDIGKELAVLVPGSSRASQAAVKRLAEVAESFAAELARAEIPRLVRTGPYAAEMQAVYCQTLAEKAEPLVVQAIAGFEACVVKGADGDLSRSCERALERLDPVAFPSQRELHGAAAALADVISMVPALETRTEP